MSSDLWGPKKPAFRLTATPGRWHEVDPKLSIMVVAVPRGRIPAYGLVYAGAHPDRSRFDWETLVEWGLAERVKPPAPVTELRPKENP